MTGTGSGRGRTPSSGGVGIPTTTPSTSSNQSNQQHSKCRSAQRAYTKQHNRRSALRVFNKPNPLPPRFTT